MVILLGECGGAGASGGKLATAALKVFVVLRVLVKGRCCWQGGVVLRLFTC